MKELLIKLLGLEANATDEQISNAAATFQTDMLSFKADMEERVNNATEAATAAEERATTAESNVETLNNTIKAQNDGLVNRDLEIYKDRIVNAEEIKTALLSNRAATIAVLKNTKAPEAKTNPNPAPLHDPKTASQPQDPTTKVNNTADAVNAKKVANRAREIAKIQNISYQQAFTSAQKEQLAAA